MTDQPTIGILAALPEYELPALQLAFGIPLNTLPEKISGERYWYTQCETSAGPTRIVISCTGLSGNTESQLPTDRMIRAHKPEFMIFVGVGCGIRKYALGDVVTSDAIWAYEYLKSTSSGTLDRSRARVTARHIQDDVAFFSALDEWQSRIRLGCSQGQKARLPRAIPERPELHRSIWIASGEKVMANGELARLNKSHDLIRAGEMEGYGFANICEDRRPPVPWLVVRGVSDYGDETKDGSTESGPQKDEYHAFAAISAAAFSRAFISSGYTFERQGERVSRRSQSSRRAESERFGGAPKEIQAIYSSDHDPGFVREVLSRVAAATTKVVFAGMGLSFLKGNTELISALGVGLKRNRRLQVEIYYGDPANKGIKNRVREEGEESERRNVAYKRDWPTAHLESIVKALKNKVDATESRRISVTLADCLPMLTIVKIDDCYFWYPYGTPNIRGKESPWILIDKPPSNSPLKRFLDDCLSYYSERKSANLLLKSSEGSK